MTTRAVVIAGAGSGCGKTTVTLGLMAAFRQRGLKVQGFKAGPDYIDPSHHRLVTGRPSLNLDTWMMPEPYLRYSFASRAEQADISVIEGVMGLYDGRRPDAPEGSTAELAETLGLPVILVIAAASMARTAAAIVQGLVNFNPQLNIIGVIFNHVGSESHLALLKTALQTYCGLPVLGGLQKDAAFSIPSRHLGLYMGEEGGLPPERISRLGEIFQNSCDLEKVFSRAVFSPLPAAPPVIRPGRTRKRLGIARDAAFCFYYPDNLEILEQLGYEPVFFSPLADRRLPEQVEAFYFGGGYPELHAEALSGNASLRQHIRQRSREGALIYAECGGLMYLGRSLLDTQGREYSMTGCLDYHTRMLPELCSLGYVEVAPDEDFFILRRGRKLRGHVFHYSEIVFDGPPPPNIYSGDSANQAPGYRIRNTLASYAHLHFSHLLF